MQEKTRVELRYQVSTVKFRNAFSLFTRYPVKTQNLKEVKKIIWWRAYFYSHSKTVLSVKLEIVSKSQVTANTANP